MSWWRANDDGFTLIELLVSITIIGVLMAAIGGALFTLLRSTNDDQRQLSQSNAEQQLSNVLSRDIESACFPNTDTANPPTCPIPASTSVANPTVTYVGPGPTPCAGTATNFTIASVSTATGSAADTLITYSFNAGAITRSVTFPVGPPATTTVVLSGVKCMDSWTPTTGPCAGQYEVDVTMAGSTQGNGTSEYSFKVCAYQRQS